MEQSPSWEAANCLDTHELPSILRSPKVYYHVHKSLQLVPVLSQINPVHITPSNFSKIYFNIILPPTSTYSYRSLSFWLCRQNPINIHLIPMRASFPACLTLLDLIYIWRRTQIMKLLITQFSLASCHVIPLRFKYSSQHPLFEHPQSMFLS
jgi:hypothetical protein